MYISCILVFHIIFLHLFYLVCYLCFSALLPTDSPTWNDDEWGKDGWGDGGWEKDTADPTAEPTWKGDDWNKDSWGDGGWPDGGGNKVRVLCTV